MSNAPLDPLGFDPLAALEEMTGKGSPTEEARPPAFDIPLDLDILASPRPGETPQALLARSAAAARDAAAGRSTLGPGASPVRAVRHCNDPARHDPPSNLAQPVAIVRGNAVPLKNSAAPPFPFDFADPLNTLAIAQLAIPAHSDKTAYKRVQAARQLMTAYEQHHRSPLRFPDALRWWYLAARRCADLPVLLGRPGLSPATVRLQALRAVAHDFAEAMALPLSLRADAFEAAGLPMPRDKRGRPTLPKDYPPKFAW